MKKFAALFFPAVLFAAEIGYVDLDYVIDNSFLKERVAADNAAEKKILAEEQSAILHEMAAIRSEQITLASLLTYQEYQKTTKEYDLRLREKEARLKEAFERYAAWEKSNSALLYDELHAVLKMVAAEKKVRVIVNRPNTVLYGERDLDLSQNVLDILNKISERDKATTR